MFVSDFYSKLIGGLIKWVGKCYPLYFLKRIYVKLKLFLLKYLIELSCEAICPESSLQQVLKL